MNLKNYEIIEFRDKELNRKRRGVKIGKYLAVVPEYKIYRFKDGISLFDVTFKNMEDAIKFAKWIDEIYGKYFEIWDDDPRMNIFSLTKWTAPNGIVTYELINLLETSYEKIEIKELDGFLEKAKKNALVWTSQLSG